MSEEPHPPSRSKNRRVAGGIGAVLAAGAGVAGIAYVASNRSDFRTAPRRVPATLKRPGQASATSAFAATTLEGGKPDPIASFRIVGSEAAKKDIRASLGLIAGLADQSFWKVVEEFHPVLIADAKVFGVTPGLRKVNISDQERNYLPVHSGNQQQDRLNKEKNEKWLASSIVHESVQGMLFYSGKSYEGAEAENLALFVQGKALEAMHGDSNQINWVNDEIDPTNSPADYWNRYKNGMIQP